MTLRTIGMLTALTLGLGLTACSETPEIVASGDEIGVDVQRQPGKTWSERRDGKRSGMRGGKHRRGPGRDSMIKKIDDNHYEVSGFGLRRLSHVELGDDLTFPDHRGLSRLGLEEGDVLASVNGVEVTTVEEANDAIEGVSDATQVEVGVVRGDETITIVYDVVQRQKADSSGGPEPAL